MIGVDILIHVNTGSPESPDWSIVGGQRNATYNERRDSINVGSKDSPGQYREREYGPAEWSITCDGVYIESGEAYALLTRAIRDQDKVMVRWVEEDGPTMQGTALVTSRSLSGPYEGEATYSMELQGDGEPIELPDELSNNLSALTGIEEDSASALVFVPEFAGGTYAYVVSVAALSGWVKLTPTAAEGVIKVNGQVVSSGSQSGEVALGDAGSLTEVVVTVTETDKVPVSYVIMVARAAS